MKNITYAIDQETGFVYSRVGSEIAFPVLEYDKMLPENNYAMNYHLEKADISSFSATWDLLKWTKKIPLELKNKHRKFWEFKLLKCHD